MIGMVLVTPPAHAAPLTPSICRVTAPSKATTTPSCFYQGDKVATFQLVENKDTDRNLGEADPRLR